MKNTFQKVIQRTNELNVLLEDLLNMLPGTPKNYKLKVKVESAYRTLKQAMMMHESLITDQVPKVNVKTENYPQDFVNTWTIYKDFMVEQFGLRMGSRMQLYRITLLMDLADNDLNIAARFLRYYMAAGSSNIYYVKELKPEEEEKNGQKGKAGFTLPKPD